MFSEGRFFSLQMRAESKNVDATGKPMQVEMRT